MDSSDTTATATIDGSEGRRFLGITWAHSPFASEIFVLVTLAVSALLLVTMGAAILAAPFTIPALAVITRSRSGWRRGSAVVLATLTVAEVGWAATYLVVAEAKPWIWMVPVMCAVATGALLTARARPGRRAGTGMR